jgi:hypothetical protein
MQIKQSECQIILYWHEYANEDSFHYGGPAIDLPMESNLIENLKNRNNESITLIEEEIELIGEWMHKTINRKYGNAKYLTGAEKEIYEIIEEEFIKIEEKRQKYQKNVIEEERIKAEEEKIKVLEKAENEAKLQVAETIVHETKEIKNEFDTRSFEEKMKAAIKLKEEIEEIKHKTKGH